jgi:hypothetical protein
MIRLIYYNHMTRDAIIATKALVAGDLRMLVAGGPPALHTRSPGATGGVIAMQ